MTKHGEWHLETLLNIQNDWNAIPISKNNRGTGTGNRNLAIIIYPSEYHSKVGTLVEDISPKEFIIFYLHPVRVDDVHLRPISVHKVSESDFSIKTY